MALAVTGALFNHLKYLWEHGEAAFASYATLYSIPATYKAGTATTYHASTAPTYHASTAPSNVFKVEFTCAFDKNGNCVFLQQNVPYTVTRASNGEAIIMPGNGGPESLTFPKLDDAIRNSIDQKTQIDYQVLPQSNSKLPQNTKLPQNSKLPQNTKALPPPTTSAPPPAPLFPLEFWKGDYAKINSSDLHLNDYTFNPIVVKLIDDKNILEYKNLGWTGNEAQWADENVRPKAPDRNYGVFASFNEAAQGAGLKTPQPSPGGGGKRTRKNKKTKTSNRKKHKSMRKRRS